MRKIKLAVTIMKLTAVAAIAHVYDTDGPQDVSSERKVRRAIANYVVQYGAMCVDDHKNEATEKAWEYAEKTYQKYFSNIKKR